MSVIYLILLDSLKILTILSGILGIALSLLIIISLDTTKTVSEFFNQAYNIDTTIKKIEKHIQMDSIFYKNNIFFGLFLMVISSIFLIFLFFILDTESLIFHIKCSKQYKIFFEVLFKSMSLFGKISGTAGFFIGFMLCFMKNIMKRIESYINYWLSTQSLEEKLNDIKKDTDTICFLHPIFFGVLGLITSLILTILSFTNLLTK